MSLVLLWPLVYSTYGGQSSDLDTVLEGAQKSLDARKTVNQSDKQAARSENTSAQPKSEPISEVQPSITDQESLSQEGNSYVSEKCGVSIMLPKDWTATESDFIFEDKSKTLADFESADESIFHLELALENFGIAKYSPIEILKSERDYANLSPNGHLLKSQSGQINGFPSYTIAYSTGSPGEYEFYIMEILIVAYDREYRLAYEAADKAEFDKYESTVEDMAKTIKITEPNYEGINC